MAQRVEYILVDDLDKGPAAETVTFSLDGATYEIDLSEENARRLRDDVSHWAAHARRVGPGGRRPATGRRSAPKRNDLGSVRDWARANGHTVSDRGRISAEIQAAYDKAH